MSLREPRLPADYVFLGREIPSTQINSPVTGFRLHPVISPGFRNTALHEQPPIRDTRVEFSVMPDIGTMHAAINVPGLQLIKIAEASCCNQLHQVFNHRRMIACYPGRLKINIQRLVTCRVLGSDPRRAGIPVAMARLNTAQRKHHRARCINRVCAQGQQPQHVKGGCRLARSDDAN